MTPPSPIEYLMIYRGPAFLRSYDLAPRPLSPVGKLSLLLSPPVCRRSSLLTGRGGGGGAESSHRKKAWPSINYSLLSGQPPPSPSPFPPPALCLSGVRHLLVMCDGSCDWFAGSPSRCRQTIRPLECTLREPEEILVLKMS
jgi:hypothetical protein